MGKILKREPPDWQAQKLVLANRMVTLLEDILFELKWQNSRHAIKELKDTKA